MPDESASGGIATPIAIVGLACRFPDADDPLALFESALAGRRAFRRLPPGRLGLPGGAGDAGLLPSYPARAGLLEGWQFSPAEFGIAEPVYRAVDPAHWLALETAGRALADAGFPGGQGLPRERSGVIIGNTLNGGMRRAVTLCSRWPDVAAPLPDVTGDALTRGQPGAIADRICRQFGFRGGGLAVDTAHPSALLAVVIAGALLTAGELDFVLAGGIDISLDPFELDGLARAGALARSTMRIYDASPTGFLPAEGCGVLGLMRSADARAAGMPIYAEIAGWGVSSAGQTTTGPDPGSQLLALQRAYARAGISPADIQLIEGDGCGTADGDLAELTALTAVRAGATTAAALGSIKANIGHAKAAAGVAGLIKAALAVNAGVIPPATGCAEPHPLIMGGDATLRVPQRAESWPAGTRLAAVSATDPGGSNVHVVLCRENRQPPGPPRARRGAATVPAAAQPSGAGPCPLSSWSVPSAPCADAFVFSEPDPLALAAALAGVATAAPWLSDGELGDLACQLGRQPGRGPARAGIVAASQDELARLAAEAARLASGLAGGRLLVRPGVPQQPVMVPAGQAAPPGQLVSPLDPSDVLLLSGGITPGMLGVAQWLARYGARLAVVTAGPGPGQAHGSVPGAGRRMIYVQADVTDPDAAETAVASIEQQLGPVTAVLHGASAGPVRDCAALSAKELAAQLARQTDELSSVLGSVSAAGLRLLVTFGSVLARYGAPGNCAAALVASALAEQGRQLRPSLPGCRILHVDWPAPAAGPRPGRPGPAAGQRAPEHRDKNLGRLLCQLLRDTDVPARVAIHGRVPPPAVPPALAAPPRPDGPGWPPPGGSRFLEHLLVHYPGVELIAEACLGPQTDPYLADHQIDGLLVLPMAIGLEAMAEAASLLAGQPLRQLAEVRMDAPIVLPAGQTATTLRICALRQPDSVTAVLRYAGSGFHVDHFRAVFPVPGAPAAGPADLPGPRPGAATLTGIVDGIDLYGPVFFQAGSLRRVAFVQELTSRSCRALVRGADDRPWFTGLPSAASAALVLGSPGRNDAVLHLAQACLPHRRVLPTACTSMVVSRWPVPGALHVSAVQAVTGQASTGQASTGQASATWDMTAVDAAGRAVLTVTGLRLRDMGPLPRTAPWHPALLAASLESRAAELGLDPSLQVTVRSGRSDQDGPHAPRQQGATWADASPGSGVLAGYELAARASMPVACHWEAAGPPLDVQAGPPPAGPATGPDRDALAGLASDLRDRSADAPATAAARLRAITACLAAAGWTPATRLIMEQAPADGWSQVRSGEATVACLVTTLDGVPRPVAIALATWPVPVPGVDPDRARPVGDDHARGAGRPEPVEITLSRQ